MRAMQMPANIGIPIRHVSLLSSGLFSISQNPENLYSSPLVSRARRARDSYSVLNEGTWGRLIRLFYPECLDMASLRHLKLTRKKRIVDVGCGTDFLLYYLREAGFEIFWE